jgi:hypothetical protein
LFMEEICRAVERGESIARHLPGRLFFDISQYIPCSIIAQTSCP